LSEPQRHPFERLSRLIAVLAATLPSLLAYNVSPSPTFLNQALALALWGWLVVAAGLRHPRGMAGDGLLQSALLLTLAAIVWSGTRGSLPGSLALSGIGLIVATAVLVASGAAVHGPGGTADAYVDFSIGWAVAGALNVLVAAIQIFAPEWSDTNWIAHSGFPGRAVGNLRQPNHLSSLLMWSTIAVVALLELRRLAFRPGALLFALLIVAVVWSASRTGVVSVGLLAVWGLLDRRLSPATRRLLVAAPLMYAAAWLLMAGWARLSAHAFGGTERLAETDISASRFGIWGNTLKLIGEQPWAGVGFGDFNFAWTLTPFPGRPVAFFDHAHNLPLQLAAELGLPLAALIVGLLLAAVWRAGRLALASTGELGITRRCALAMVVMIGVHSMLEYPLWYAYFLLPAAWAFGFAVGEPARERRYRLPGLLPAAGIALVVGAVLSVADYVPVTRIFSADADTIPLEQRIARGQKSVLFAHHADYAAATVYTERYDPKPFTRAVHYLLDTRLMIAWAKTLAANGRVDEARFVADRLREFRNPGADEFFDACNNAGASPPFQCTPAARPHDWREFLR
jgi:O-antigen ligase